MKRGKIHDPIILGLLDIGMFFVETDPDPDPGSSDVKKFRALVIEDVVNNILSVEASSVYCCIDIRTGFQWNLSSDSGVMKYVPSEEEKLAAIPYLA